MESESNINSIKRSHVPSTAPSSADLMGGFGDRLFEHIALMGEFPITAHQIEQHRKQAVLGSLFFGFFFWLGKRKKLASRAKATL